MKLERQKSFSRFLKMRKRTFSCTVGNAQTIQRCEVSVEGESVLWRATVNQFKKVRQSAQNIF